MAAMKLSDILKAGNVTGRAFGPREKVFSQGDSSDEGVCLLLEGAVEAFHAGAAETDRPIASYSVGGYFGLGALLGIPRFESTFAGVSGAKVLFINEADFLRYLRADEGFLARLFQSTLRRLRSIPEYLNKMRNKYVPPGKRLFDNENDTDTNIYLLVESQMIKHAVI